MKLLQTIFVTLTQEEVNFSGHAIELRINAEDPDQDFKPCPGLVDTLRFPNDDGIRVDSHLTSGDRIPPQYDSMIAKLIIHAPTRALAIEQALIALEGTTIDGVTTNLDLHRRILTWKPFVDGDYNTTSLENDLLAGGA